MYTVKVKTSLINKNNNNYKCFVEVIFQLTLKTVSCVTSLATVYI